MNESNILKRIWLGLKNRSRLLLCNLGHDPFGPFEGIQFEIEPGKWHPYYQCRRCGRMLKWQISGGWKADG